MANASLLFGMFIKSVFQVKIVQFDTEPLVDAGRENIPLSSRRWLAHAERTDLSLGSRSALAYNAVHAFAPAALRDRGYETELLYLVFACLLHTPDLVPEQKRVLDHVHRKRNLADDERETVLDDQLGNAMTSVARKIER